MHNGQVGGFEKFRKAADMAIADEHYAFRKGSTDSEVLFLLALGFGLDRDPIGAMEKAVGKLETLSRETGVTPHMRLSAAFSDGQSLYAARYSSDHIAPSVYYRYSETRKGWAVVSEPLETEESGWTALEPGKLLKIDNSGATEFNFHPA